MKVLSPRIISTVRSGSYQYATVESITRGLATIKLGKNSGGARMTNLSYIGTIQEGDLVMVDFGTNRPYVRAISEVPLEEEPEEVFTEEEIVAPMFERMKMGASDPCEILCFADNLATSPANNAVYISAWRILGNQGEWCNLASYNLGETWQIWEPIGQTDLAELHDDLTEWAVHEPAPWAGLDAKIWCRGVSPYKDWSWFDIYAGDAGKNGLYCSNGARLVSPDTGAAVSSVSIIEELNMVIFFVWDAISQTGGGNDVVYSTNGATLTRMNMPLKEAPYKSNFRYLNGTLFLQTWVGGLWKTTDMGETWTPINLDLPTFREDRMPIAISGDGNFVYTAAICSQNISTDGGNSWGPIYQLADSEWNETMPGWWWGGQWETYRCGINRDGQHSVLLDYNGILLVSNNYMQSWKPAFIENTSDSNSRLTVYYFQNGGYPASISVSDDGSIMVIGGSCPTWYQEFESHVVRPVVYISTNYGQTFKECEVYSPDELPRAWIPWVVVSSDGSTIYVCTWGEADYWRKPDKIFKTTDYGDTWQEVTPPGYEPFGSGDIGFASIQTSSDGMVVSALSYQKLWVSRDGGQTWEAKLDDGSWYYGYELKPMAMDKTGNIFIVADKSWNETIKISYDGGDSWQIVDVDPCVCYSVIEWISTNDDFSRVILQTDWGYIYINADPF